MKKSIYAAAVLIILQSVLVGQRKSDYATVDRFKKSIEAISESVDKANTVQECAEANVAMDMLMQEFSEDTVLLNKAIYPDGYRKTIEKLHGKLMIRQKDLGIIESQVIRITELETQVRQLSDQVSALNTQNEKLLEQIQLTSKKAIDSLTKMVTKLQNGLQRRDELIFALADSLFLQYGKNIGDMKDIEKQGLVGKLERHTIFGNIRKSIMDNVTFLEATQLKGNDIVTLVRQQQRFKSQWSGLSPRLASLYLSGKSKKNEVGVVDSMLNVWGDKVDIAMWRSLNNIFKEKGFIVKEFNNGDEFCANLISFLDEQIQDPRKEMSETRYKLFANFNENLWQPDLNATWLPALVELQKISEAQKKEIDDKVDQWRSTVTPGLSWLAYMLIILGGLLVIIIAVWFFRRTSKPSAEEEEEL
jgi:hypothetical protein